MRRETYIALLALVACGAGSTEAEQPEEPMPVVAVDVTPEPASEPEVPDEEEPYCAVACREDGLCAIRDGACTALEDGHCRSSKACQSEGRCVAVEGSCVAGGLPLLGGHPCDRWVALARECMKNMPPQAQASMDQAIASMQEVMKSPASREAMIEGCEQMIEAFEKTPLCAGSVPAPP